MDILSELIFQLLNLGTTLQPYLHYLLSTLSLLRAQISPLLIAFLAHFSNFAQNSPTIVTLAFFLLILAVSLQILNFAQRVVVFWTKLFFKLCLMGVVAVMVALVYQRGVGRTVEELLVFGGEMGDAFRDEYGKGDGRWRVKGERYGNAGTGWR